jgi:hypothetical protein
MGGLFHMKPIPTMLPVCTSRNSAATQDSFAIRGMADIAFGSTANHLSRLTQSGPRPNRRRAYDFACACSMARSTAGVKMRLFTKRRADCSADASGKNSSTAKAGQPRKRDVTRTIYMVVTSWRQA